MCGYQASGHWSAARLDAAPLGLRWRDPIPTSLLGRPANTAGHAAPCDPSGRHRCAPRPFGAVGSLGAASGVALGRRTRARVRRTRVRSQEGRRSSGTYRADTAPSTYPVRIYYGFEAVARGHGAREAPTSLGPAAPDRRFHNQPAIVSKSMPAVFLEIGEQRAPPRGGEITIIGSSGS